MESNEEDIVSARRHLGTMDTVGYIDVGSWLCVVIGKFLEGEPKMLADTAEVRNPQSLGMHRSGLELWRLQKYNFDRASAFNATSILESFRYIQTTKEHPTSNVENQRPRKTTSQLLQQAAHVASVFTHSSSTRTWRKCFLTRWSRSKSTNIDFEKGS